MTKGCQPECQRGENLRKPEELLDLIEANGKKWLRRWQKGACDWIDNNFEERSLNTKGRCDEVSNVVGVVTNPSNGLSLTIGRPQTCPKAVPGENSEHFLNELYGKELVAPSLLMLSDMTK